ncbi:MAG: hypothetical protein H6708_02820 [Kofleriaceae bacterium]|nr:hypothetical protein [Kofleriaceae bacterium]
MPRPDAGAVADGAGADPQRRGAPRADAAWLARATQVELADGRRLVFGGGTDRAVLWDGDAATELAPLPAVSDRATATLLEDGRVLIAGGLAPRAVDDPDADADADGPDDATAAALLWSEADGFVALPAMTGARVGHTATRLASGDVLVTGGEDADDGMSPVATAELFIVERSAWRPVGAMEVARFGHTATLLPDGRVVIIGGEGGDLGTTDVVEVWDAATGAFTVAAHLRTSRLGHAVEVESAHRVVVRGGTSIDPPDEGPPVHTELADDAETVELP